MKLKKLYMSFTCYLTLVAFISIISIEVSYSKLQHQKIEVSTNTNLSNANLNLLFEEDRGSSELILDTLLACTFFLPVILMSAGLSIFRTTYFKPRKDHLSLKIPLFLSLRALRL